VFTFTYAALISGGGPALGAGAETGAGAGVGPGVGAPVTTGAAGGGGSLMVRPERGLRRSANASKPGVGLVLATVRLITLTCWVMASASLPTVYNVSCTSRQSSCSLFRRS